MLFKKLFKRRNSEEKIISIPSSDDGEFYGNTNALLKSIDGDISRTAAEALGFDPNNLSEEELNNFSELGWVLYRMACGFHISKEELERYEKTGHLTTL